MAPQLQEQNLILDKAQIEQKIMRIAYQIYEKNFEEQEIVLAGIYENGYTLAQMLAEKLQAISPIQVQLLCITLNKTAPLSEPILMEPKQPSLTDKVIVLVDDVLNTGKTLAYTLNTFLAHNPKKVEIATLVDRHHPLYPVAATYTGYSLATTLNEHIMVYLNEEKYGAYLH
ncbi:phosphoribosyltransferase [Pontibacter diazotrophicus]|uniref:Phosphoribosyltransferase n=1 Tax=Pontibacter diazotrophicus TaxID=1400979 RepID=A0A3D8LCV3_9BACT|nr:phosphoribosyltransferase family protein [Pontibacter diazotrophicus]RDV15126.1 phosphoribosyltransferase [Pontibacter diazotrophicus]